MVGDYNKELFTCALPVAVLAVEAWGVTVNKLDMDGRHIGDIVCS